MLKESSHLYLQYLPSSLSIYNIIHVQFELKVFQKIYRPNFFIYFSSLRVNDDIAIPDDYLQYLI